MLILALSFASFQAWLWIQSVGPHPVFSVCGKRSRKLSQSVRLFSQGHSQGQDFEIHSRVQIRLEECYQLPSWYLIGITLCALVHEDC